MKYSIYILVFFTCFTFSGLAQQPGTIKVKREQKLVKIYFDNTDYKLIPIDRFGNPQENKVKSYKFWIKGNEQPFEGSSSSLNFEMIQALKKLKKATKIYITEIQVEDDNSHLIKLPDVYEVWFPDCKNCDNKGKKR